MAVDAAVQREVIGEVVAGERWLSFPRLVRRTVSGAITKEPRCNGNVESWRAMRRRDPILVWHVRSFARKRARMRAWGGLGRRPAGAAVHASA